ncbi:hypothetical protein PBCVAP110A_407R [Paramecium bursaria Chlorella virus AP110A]|nr:hypothetical protein PBCVAP110A_407R [Paramecium bursaria Chlorella virus AP110A]
MGYKDPQKQKECQQQWYQTNKQAVYQRGKARRIEARQSANDSLISGHIIDMRLWNLWFNNKAKNKSAYDLSATEAFNLIKQRCFYCGDFATTLDRLDSTLAHNAENCVGCCLFCNSSKGAMDPMTFIFQAVYRRTFIYYDSKDIWGDNRAKPRLYSYKENASKQNRKFELTQSQFDEFIIGECHYCQRSPLRGKFFSIDKLIPDDGYTLDNCVTACISCNCAKWTASVEEFTLRDERITQRYLTGYFDDMPKIPRHISYYKR